MKCFYILFLILLPFLSSGTGWSNEMDSLAKITETKYKLPHGICRAFALQESNYNQYATRVESNYISDSTTFARNIRLQAYEFSKRHQWQPSVLTEVVQRGTSYTLFQIMGENLRNMDFQYPFFYEDLALRDQFRYFGTFISTLLIKHQGNVAFAASEYNGGSGAIRGGDFKNPRYVHHILRYLDEFKY